MSIIETLLDQDAYKFSMQQAVLHQFPATEVEYAFKCRNKANWTPEIVRDINLEIDHLCTLRFEPYELVYLSSIRWLKKDYIDFLSLFQLNRKHINAWLNEKGELEVRIKGSWLLTILFEVPVLAIVNEVYYKHNYPALYGTPECHKVSMKEVEKKLVIMDANPDLRIADFGTRRRFSFNNQRDVITQLRMKGPRDSFVGTSNVEIARIYHFTPIGTMGHEWIQCGQANGVRLIDSQKYMLQKWVDEYRGELGIALSDTLGVNAFIKDFDSYFAKLYDGVRQDSGVPFTFGDKIIAHYESMRIDPRTKTIVFSDSLTFTTAVEIMNYFKGRIKTSFGIGTNLTNDVGIAPLNCVIKVVKCNGQPVAKISDSIGKTMCEDESYVKYLKEVFKIN